MNKDFKSVIDGIKVSPPEPVEQKVMAPKTDGRLQNAQTFKKGQSGNPAGRRPGTKVNKTVRQIAEEMGFNPIEAAILMIREDPRIKKRYKIRDGVDTKLKVNLLEWIGDKMYASLKSVDYTMLDGTQDDKPKTIQLYLPEKNSFEKRDKEQEREVVKLELTPELGTEIVSPCDPKE